MIELDQVKEEVRRTKMLQEYCKDPQIELRIKMWIKDNGQMVRPPIFFDVQEDRWFWANRAKRKLYMKRENRNATRNRSTSSDKQSSNGNGTDEVRNTINRIASSSPTTGNNEREEAGRQAQGEQTEEDSEGRNIRDVTELDHSGQNRPFELVSHQGQEKTNDSEASR